MIRIEIDFLRILITFVKIRKDILMKILTILL